MLHMYRVNVFTLTSFIYIENQKTVELADDITVFDAKQMVLLNESKSKSFL